MLSLWRGVTGFFHFLELATVGGRFYFSKWCLTCCQGGRHFDLLWGRAINPSKNYLFLTVFLQFHVFIQTALSVCRGVSARFHFLELATVGGRFFFSKWGLTCCQGGRHVDLPWAPAINPSKNYLSALFFPSVWRFLCYSISGWVRVQFLELATVGGRFFSPKEALHVAKGVDILICFGSSYKPL